MIPKLRGGKKWDGGEVEHCPLSKAFLIRSNIMSGDYEFSDDNLHITKLDLLSTAERRGTPVLLSASVSDNSGNSPKMSAPRRSREIDQSTQRFSS